jgi:hypothetical protein
MSKALREGNVEGSGEGNGEGNVEGSGEGNGEGDVEGSVARRRDSVEETPN